MDLPGEFNFDGSIPKRFKAIFNISVWRRVNDDLVSQALIMLSKVSTEMSLFLYSW